MKWVQPIGQILGDVIRDLGLSKKMSEQRAVVEWPQIVGPRVAEHSRAIKVDGGRLLVQVDSSVWSQELTLMKQTILRQVNDRLGRPSIEGIHFVLGGTAAGDARGGDAGNGRDGEKE
jgi:predicted nucleic acid-binding Zn ribbon protein